MTNINLDTILSDPMLLVGTLFLVLGPALFLFSLVKYFTTKDKPKEEKQEPIIPIPEAGPNEETMVQETPAPPPAKPAEPPPLAPAPQPSAPTTNSGSVKELEAQIDILVTQIKNLNKKVSELEDEIDHVSRQSSAKLEPHELKELPKDPAEFSTKLLKLAEHVIVLEKEVARLKGNDAEPPQSGGEGKRPPVMPL